MQRAKIKMQNEKIQTKGKIFLSFEL